jgi:hypothetical protein
MFGTAMQNILLSNFLLFALGTVVSLVLLSFFKTVWLLLHCL